MQLRLTLADRIDLWGFGLISLYALGCALGGGRNFSTLHISIPGIPVPFFVGEILMAVCLGLLAVRCKVKPVTWTQWQKAVWVFWAAILVKMLWDFLHWGPLALRNGATYYYVIFTLLAGVFYNPRFFVQSVWIVLSLILLYLTSIYFDAQYYLWSCLMLFVVSLSQVKSAVWRLVIGGLFVALLDYGQIFAESRTGLFATIGAVLFLSIIGIKYFVRPRALQWAIAILVAFICAMGLFFSADRNGLKSCTRIKAIYDEYRQDRITVRQARASDGYHPRSLPVALYHRREVICPQFNMGNYLRTLKKSNSRLLFLWVLCLVGLAMMLYPQGHKKAGTFLFAATLVCQLYTIVSDNRTASDPPLMVQVSPFGLTPARQHQAPVPCIHLVAASQLPVSVASLKTIGPCPVAPASADLSRRPMRSLDTAIANAVFRMLIWADMWDELINRRAWLGVGLGEPQRSPSIEILNFADEFWVKDGWITPHNLYFHMVYRLGIVGLGLIVLWLGWISAVVKTFVQLKSWQGIALMSIIVYWMMASSFLVILELPHFAIPFWSLFGLILAYRQRLLEAKP